MPARYRRARLIDWVGKADTTFSDAITAVRRWLWQEWFLQSPVIPQPLQNSVGRFEICCYTVWHRRRRVKIRAKVELRRVVRHANFQAKAIRQGFQMVFENVASGGVAAAAVAQEQQPASIGIREAPIDFPPVTQTVAGEPTGVVAEAQIQMPEVALGIVEPVRVEHPESGTRKIVVERLLDFLRVEPPFAKQKAQKLLGFGVHAHDGIGGLIEFRTGVGDDPKLGIASGMFSQRQRFASLATSQAMPLQKLRHHVDTDAEALLQELLGDPRTGEVGPKNSVLIGVARRARIDDFQESCVDR